MKSIVKAMIAWAGYRLVPVLPEHDLRLMQLVDALKRFSQAEPLFKVFLEFCSTRFSDSDAQLMQDLFVDFVLQKAGGTFVEFGAYDGVTFSNSRYLERVRGWRGVLAEPTPRLQVAIANDRPLAILDKRCVYGKSGLEIKFSETGSADLSTIRGLERSDHMARFRNRVEVHRVPTVSLDDLIASHFKGEEVDYVSVDTEGSEWEILSNYEFTGNPAVFTVEHNFSDHRDDLSGMMLKHGYVNVFPSYTGFDDWFVRNDIYRRRFAA